MKTSIYQNAAIVKRGRKFFATCIDFIILFVLSFILYGLSDLVLTSLPIYQEVQRQNADSLNSLYQIVSDSGLSIYRDSHLLTSDEMSSRQVKNLVYTTILDVKDKEEISTTIYEDASIITDDTDGLYHYYVTFKEENVDKFASIGGYGKEYYYDNVLNNSEYFIYNDLPYLKEEYALAIDQYYISNTMEGMRVYEELLSFFTDLFDQGREELINNYQPYLNTLNEFEINRDIQLNMRGITLLFSYTLSVLILYLMFPLIFQDGKTLTFKFMNIAYCTIDGNKPGFVNILIRMLFSLLCYLFIPFIQGFFVFGSEAVYLMDILVMGFYNFFISSCFSVVLLLISGLFDLFNRHGIHQTLAELCSLLVSKDMQVFEGKDGK